MAKKVTMKNTMSLCFEEDINDQSIRHMKILQDTAVPVKVSETDGDEIIQEISNKHIYLEYILYASSKEKIISEIESGTPILVLKDGDKIFSGKVDPSLSLSTLSFDLCPNNEHMCAMSCERLHAYPTKDGGCDKVWRRNKFLPDYDFISFGFQLFNMEKGVKDVVSIRDILIVLCCKNYCKHIEQPKKNRPFNLAEFMWEDEIKGEKDIEERIKKNFSNSSY